MFDNYIPLATIPLLHTINRKEKTSEQVRRGTNNLIHHQVLWILLPNNRSTHFHTHEIIVV